ncbi:c-type cytochrome biogenesis protein CcmI [Pelomicrobium methylotrophicum]|uniref:C-type cytochrome biogenesis protein CcmI n=1 Tax=Pelomicrobium methylotrophicum TaxID=2602750 RepID=A0A5C7EV66_9PROT|nr:c-type cytochrome biogenesis protein CcmI [Pelomicrobium methylotrophicum]TXF11136.1 c-type cytochrome biogenesis protein CcmI [Pelomicrobium methylotrophicum]
MTLFLVASGTLLALALAFILVPLMRGARRGASTDRSAVNVAVYRDHLAELDRDRASGLLTDAQYQGALDELKRRMLQDLEGAASAGGEARMGFGLRLAVPLALAIVVPVTAALLYLQLGSPEALRVSAPEGGWAASPPADVETMVARLAERLEEHPDDSKGWALLGRSYAALGRFEQATAALERARTLSPRDAQILADLADALAMTQGQSLRGRPTELLRQALEANPNHAKSLALAGAAAFERGDYAAAVRHWERLAAQLEPGSELARQVESSLSEARRRASETVAVGGGGASVAGASSARVTGVATLSPALAGRVAPGDTLFVYARAVDGPPMPIAILRAKASELPLTFTLDDSMGVVPGISLSSFPQVMVVARVSKTGDARLRSGDLVGSAGPVPLGARDVRVVIDQVAP